MQRILRMALAPCPATVALPAVGQSIMDQQLGGAGGTAAGAQTAGSKTDASGTEGAKPAVGTPVAPKMVDPDAAKIVDDMDLVRKLTNPSTAQNQTGAAEPVKDMVDLLGQSEKRLSSKDYGKVTQETQQRILVDLDALIEIARKQGSGSSNKPGEKDQSLGMQQRQRTSQEGGSTAATDENLRPGGAQTAESNGTDIHQASSDKWGNLPDRDRDLVSHGSTEQYLPEYRAMIDRYYQALSQLGRGGH